ncbi:unnamed protein product [Heterobilharzia americana]|nr:unnamed protein product [Heterobilharzia americana]CAH8522210.1 unnamed protein product [Heterobilharzia americana]
MSRSVLEMNLARLLYCTECLASQNDLGTNYNAYVKTLETFLNKLISSSYRPSAESMRKYEIRVKRLKQNCGPIHNLYAVSNHLSHDKLSPGLTEAPSADDNNHDRIVYETVPQNEDGIHVENDNSPVIHRVYADRCDLIAKERQRMNRDLREQLLGGGSKLTDKKSLSGRNQSSTTSAGLLREQEIRREQLASEMLLLTGDLKSQSSAMGQRIRLDCETVDMSIGQVERNTTNLSSVLDELSVELGSKCGRIVWFLFFISLGLFLYMILFMKMFHKRIHSNSPSLSRTEL